MKEYSDMYLLEDFDVQSIVESKYRTIFHSMRIHTKTCMNFLRREFYLPEILKLHTGIMIPKPQCVIAGFHIMDVKQGYHFIYYALPNIIVDSMQFFTNTIQHEVSHAIADEIDSAEHDKDCHGNLWQETMKYLCGEVHLDFVVSDKATEYKEIKYELANHYGRIHKERTSV